jgi:hypothetical protein
MLLTRLAPGRKNICEISLHTLTVLKAALAERGSQCRTVLAGCNRRL